MKLNIAAAFACLSLSKAEGANTAQGCCNSATLRVGLEAVEQFPWYSFDETKTGNARWSGYLPDILQGIESYTGAKMELVSVPHLKMDREEMGEYMFNGTIDVAPWLLSEDSFGRNVTKTLDFTTPFYTFHHEIITRVSVSASGGWGLFRPFDDTLWVILIFTVPILGAVTWFAEAFPVDHTVETDFPRSPGGIFGSVYYALGCVLVGGTDYGGPKTGPGRMMAVGTFFFFLIFTATYTANLASILTAVNVNFVVGSITDLRAAKVCDPAISPHPTTEAYVQSIVMPPSGVDWNHLRTRINHCTQLVQGGQVDAVVAVAPALHAYMNQEALTNKGLCDQTGAPFGLRFAETYFSLAVTRRDIPGITNTLQSALSGSIVGLQMSDHLAVLNNQYFAPSNVCTTPGGGSVVDFQEMRGLFIMVGVAMGCAVLMRLGLLAWAHKNGSFP
eukprot:Hpha_TRINITY_DN9167_c0_g1::TRINITY_DN9167_c0_g1_i1::g.94485::m.94485